MSATQKRNFFLLLALSILVLIIFSLPNSRASANIQMVQVFEPDEAVPMPYLLRMIAPVDTVEQALRHFVFYEYYYYGFPHFAYSAILLLPLKWLGKLNDTPTVMLMLRQGSSVLLMLAGILLLVYLQDRFKTYRSFVLFILLISIPAVVHNNFWWHPDGMVVLLAALILFFLQRDDLRLGKNFLFAAVLCGVLTAAKTIGAYFFSGSWPGAAAQSDHPEIKFKTRCWHGTGISACNGRLVHHGKSVFAFSLGANGVYQYFS
ncbi:MAG TPA: hypothetical protein DCP32_11255 [Anaerolineaceae bacterium]|nr:MAG: hypothetical protein A2X24_02990 [Chloroflexi bacterium GWB2_54_36]HAL17290.1 hypothetical protein [Anaerolineaceae bacterium]HBA92625.1 hypothetical protein [Anaerolineaceae bacterium]